MADNNSPKSHKWSWEHRENYEPTKPGNFVNFLHAKYLEHKNALEGEKIRATAKDTSAAVGDLHKEAKQLELLHRSRIDIPDRTVRPATYNELFDKGQQLRRSVSNNATYVQERAAREDGYKSNLPYTSSKDTSLAYHTIGGREKMTLLKDIPGTHAYSAPLDNELIGDSPFGVVGVPDQDANLKPGAAGLEEAIRAWDANKTSVKPYQYLGMRIDPRIEVVTGRTVPMKKEGHIPTQSNLLEFMKYIKQQHPEYSVNQTLEAGRKFVLGQVGQFVEDPKFLADHEVNTPEFQKRVEDELGDSEKKASGWTLGDIIDFRGSRI